MLIPKDKIEEVRAAIDIVDVVSDYVQLKKRGANFFGLCPFHGEKTASFSVNPGLGIYKCFGCGVAGDSFQFVVAIENTSFVEAVRMLAEKAGIALPESEEEEAASSEAESIYFALRFAARFYHHCLTGDDRGATALAYLRDRGFSNETIRRFGVGFAPDSWAALYDAAQREHLSDEILEKAGLIVARRDRSGFYDRFRNRITFPIINHMGKVLGFGARILEATPDQPKYLNSPETPVYHKGRVLYGLFQAKQAVRKEDSVILVEGYTDVMALHQAGVEHVVASSGTALTADQVKLLSRYAHRAILLYDSDAAGDAASVRGLERVLAAGMAADAVGLPEGQDPDSMVREVGAASFRAYVDEHRQDFVSFRYGLAERDGMLATPDGQARAVGQLLELIEAIDDPLAQESYLQRASEVTGMPQTTLWRALERRKVSQDNWSTRPAGPAASGPTSSSAAMVRRSVHLPAPPSQSTSSVHPAEESLLRQMLEQGIPMIEFILSHMSLSEFTEGPTRRAVRTILEHYEAGSFEPRMLLESGDDDEMQGYLAGIMTDRDAPSENWLKKLKISVPRLNEQEHKSAAGAMTQLKLHRVQQEIERLRQEAFEAQRAGSDLTELQRESMTLQDLRKQIERQEFINWPDTVSQRTQG